MAGHSQFKNIMYRKGAQDKKRGKIFTKIVKEIVVAVKEGGGDINSNPKLRNVIALAKSNNMPKDNIERAIKKALASGEGENYEEIRYDGYGPCNFAVIVECLSDNRNRTASELRAIFTKNGGNLGETGSLNFMFDRKGVIVYAKEDYNFDDVFDKAAQLGALDIIEDGDMIIVQTKPEDLHKIGNELKAFFENPKSLSLDWVANTVVNIPQEKVETVAKFLESLEDNDDVRAIFHNIDN